MTKRVPSEALVDSDFPSFRTNEPAQNSLPPYRFAMTPAGKDPIVWPFVRLLFSPGSECLKEKRMSRHGLL